MSPSKSSRKEPINFGATGKSIRSFPYKPRKTGYTRYKDTAARLGYSKLQLSRRIQSPAKHEVLPNNTTRVNFPGGCRGVRLSCARGWL